MRKILFPVLILGILLSMSNCKPEEEQEDPSAYTLIGTWEAESEYTTYTTGTYKSVLTFTETEYTQIDDYIPIQGRHEHYENNSTYIREEQNIVYTDEYSNKYTCPYKFINKNSLKTNAPGFTYNPDLIYKRKN